MFQTPIHFEIARLRHQENVRAAERYHRLFRRPMTVPPVPAATPGATDQPPAAPTPAPVIAMPARGQHASPCTTRVA